MRRRPPPAQGRPKEAPPVRPEDGRRDTTATPDPAPAVRYDRLAAALPDPESGTPTHGGGPETAPTPRNATRATSPLAQIRGPGH